MFMYVPFMFLLRASCIVLMSSLFNKSHYYYYYIFVSTFESKRSMTICNLMYISFRKLFIQTCHYIKGFVFQRQFRRKQQQQHYRFYYIVLFIN